jgi:hypothetical protein
MARTNETPTAGYDRSQPSVIFSTTQRDACVPEDMDHNTGHLYHHLEHFRYTQRQPVVSHGTTLSCTILLLLAWDTPPMSLTDTLAHFSLITCYDGTRRFFFGVWRIFAQVIPDISHPT